LAGWPVGRLAGWLVGFVSCLLFVFFFLRKKEHKAEWIRIPGTSGRNWARGGKHDQNIVYETFFNKKKKPKLMMVKTR
jgi:membrane-associated phospholipid phosphatase